MKAILEFNMPEEQYEFECANNGSKCMSALHDIHMDLRQYLKYGDPDTEFKTPSEAIERIKEKFFEILREYNILTEEI